MKALFFSLLLAICPVYAVKNNRNVDKYVLAPAQSEDKYSHSCQKCPKVISSIYRYQLEQRVKNHYKNGHKVTMSPNKISVKEPGAKYNIVIECPIKGCAFVLRRNQAVYNSIHDIKCRAIKHLKKKHKIAQDRDRIQYIYE